MTNSKLAVKNRIFAIICAIVIVAGMVVGTVCHFLFGGFFNYGGEFASYKSVVVTYSTAEYSDVELIKPTLDEKLGAFSAFEVSCGDKTTGGEVVYKYAPSVSSEELAKAVDEINAAINTDDSGLNVAVLHEAETLVGGSKAIIFASIAVASAAVFEFIYFAFRYKFRAAISAFVGCILNVGLFVSLVAITRLPVGTELIALTAAVVLITMIGSCVLFDRVRKNFKNDAYAKTERSEVIAISAAESKKINLVTVIALALPVVVLAICAVIALLNITVLTPYAVAILALISCCYGTVFVMPAIHSGVDALFARAKAVKAVSDNADKSKS